MLDRQVFDMSGLVLLELLDPASSEPEPVQRRQRSLDAVDGKDTPVPRARPHLAHLVAHVHGRVERRVEHGFEFCLALFERHDVGVVQQGSRINGHDLTQSRQRFS